MDNYSNNKPYYPYDFKKEVKIKHDAIKVVVENFPNGIGAMMELLRAVVPALDQADYCALTPTEQLVWEERDNDLTKSMLFLMNPKNNNTK